MLMAGLNSSGVVSSEMVRVAWAEKGAAVVSGEVGDWRWNNHGWIDGSVRSICGNGIGHRDSCRTRNSRSILLSHCCFCFFPLTLVYCTLNIIDLYVHMRSSSSDIIQQSLLEASWLAFASVATHMRHLSVDKAINDWVAICSPPSPWIVEVNFAQVLCYVLLGAPLFDPDDALNCPCPPPIALPR